MVLDLAIEQYCRFNFARTSTRRANILYILHRNRADTLTSNLHQTKLRQRQYRMLCFVGRHQTSHLVKEQLATMRLVHIDKVDYNDAAQISQAQLSCDLRRSSKIDFEHRLFLIIVGFCAVARIDVDDVHCFGRFDDEVCTSFERHIAGKQRLDLARDIEIVENRHRAAIQFYDLLLLGIDRTDVVAYLVEHTLVVHAYLRERTVEIVANNRIRTIHLAHQKRWCLMATDLLARLLPLLHRSQNILLDIQVGGIYGSRTDDDTEILRQHTGCDTLQPFFILVRANLLREKDLRREWDENNIATRKRDVARQTRTFGRDGLLRDLNHHCLTDLQQRRYLAVAFQPCIEFHRFEAHTALTRCVARHDFIERREVSSQVLIVDKSVAFVTDIDERGIESGHNFTHFAEVDVADGKARLRHLFSEFDEFAILAERNVDLG